MAKKDEEFPAKILLARLALLLDENERQIQRIADEGFIPKPPSHGIGRGEYDCEAAIRGVKEYYKKKASAVSDSAAADRARRERADADSAEIDLAEKLRLLCFKSDVRAIWEDGKVSMRKAIQKSRKIPEKVKPEVIEIIQSAKINEAGDDSEE